MGAIPPRWLASYKRYDLLRGFKSETDKFWLERDERKAKAKLNMKELRDKGRGAER